MLYLNFRTCTKFKQNIFFIFSEPLYGVLIRTYTKLLMNSNYSIKLLLILIEFIIFFNV